MQPQEVKIGHKDKQFDVFFWITIFNRACRQLLQHVHHMLVELGWVFSSACAFFIIGHVGKAKEWMSSVPFKDKTRADKRESTITNLILAVLITVCLYELFISMHPVQNTVIITEMS